MKFSTILTLATALSGVEAYWKGFNLGANNPDGSCKSLADWEKDFTVMSKLPLEHRSARLFASSDCGTLANAVPAAIAVGTRLLVGVWTEDAAHYAAEKAALQAAIQQHGHAWAIAVSVGSEDLYRGDTSASTLVGQIDDVRTLLQGLGAGSLWVGHVDTWTAWVNPANSAVIEASDFIGTDGYPYYQDSSINDAYNVFWQSVANVQAAVKQYSPGKPVFITESGWPVSGPTLGAAVPSLANAKQYWDTVFCQCLKTYDTFWFTLQDYTSSPSFGVLDANFNPLWSLTC